MKYIITEEQYKLLESSIEDDDIKTIEDFKRSISDEGEFKDILSDITIGDDYKDKIKNILNRIRELVYSSGDNDGISNIEKSYETINLVNRLKRLKRFLNHPIHINEYKDKYGNIYLQSRTTLKGSDGKTKWINAYVGKLKDFPDGANSLDVLIKGKTLLRKKIEPLYNI
jgi:hypothetical protein